MVIGVLGALPFITAEGHVFTFHGLSHDLSTEFAEHKVLGGRPVLEWTGDGLETVSLSIRLDSSLGVPPAAGMKMLHALMDSHRPQPLVIGGAYWGGFVIEKVAEEHRYFTGLGICQVAEVSVSLKQFSKGWI